MLDIAKNIRSLSDFKRNTTEMVQRMKRSGDPVVLTVNGKAEVVVQDAASYQKLLEEAEFARTLQILSQSMEDVKRGRTKPAREFLEGLARKHGIDLRK